MQMKDIGFLRLAAQRASFDHFNKPEEVVKHLLAMQAQDYAGALWSIGLRTKNSSLLNVEQAIKDRKIVRTWPMRGTLHFLHADDVHWMVKLLAPRATAAAKTRRLSMGLTDEIVEEVELVLRNALKGGTSILRNEVATLLNSKIKSLEITNQHTQHLMRHFGERGVLCFGPHQGKQPTFVLLDEWVTPPPEKPHEEALKELAFRYFTSHGPASLKDFAGWGMMTMADAKYALQNTQHILRSEEVNGITYYFSKGLKLVPQKEALLLPGFDEFLLGYKDRSAVLEFEHSNKIVPGNNGMFLPTVIENGQVIGLWKRKVTSREVIFSYDGFYGQLGVLREEDRYRSFIFSDEI